MTAGLQHRVFIAHAEDASDFTLELAARLRNSGVAIFLDDPELPDADIDDAALQAAVASCSLFIFVVSARAIESGAYALIELDWAVGASCDLLGVTADGHEHVIAPPEVVGTRGEPGRSSSVAHAVAQVHGLLSPGMSLRLKALLTLGVVTALGVVAMLSLKAPPYAGPVRPTGAHVVERFDAGEPAASAVADASQPVSVKMNDAGRPIGVWIGGEYSPIVAWAEGSGSGGDGDGIGDGGVRSGDGQGATAGGDFAVGPCPVVTDADLRRALRLAANYCLSDSLRATIVALVVNGELSVGVAQSDDPWPNIHCVRTMVKRVYQGRGEMHLTPVSWRGCEAMSVAVHRYP